MRLVRINGELAEIVPANPGRAKIIYLAGEPQDRLPTEVEYADLELEGSRGVERVTLKSPDVLLVERVEPDLRHSLDPRHLMDQLLAQFVFKRAHRANRRTPSRRASR